MKKMKLVTSTALFDGHDVSINVFRQMLQRAGAELVHLGHNRSVLEVVNTAIQEDADAILISSYQGGHNEYFKFVIDSLKELNASNIKVFGGGGGTILPAEIKALEEYGVEKIYHANDGVESGLDGIVEDVVSRIKSGLENVNLQGLLKSESLVKLKKADKAIISKYISFVEEGNYDNEGRRLLDELSKNDSKKSLVLGITGTGGSGKSSLLDELVGRFLEISKDIKIGILAVDPSKRISGGALLGDKIRMNNVYSDRVYMRSFASRDSMSEISTALSDSIKVLKASDFDLIIAETSGIGQSNSRIVDITDFSLYVMTSEFGAPSQLEKIDMLELADFVAINKYEKPGSEDAFNEVKINYLRNRRIIGKLKEGDETRIPLYATIASEFNNIGVNLLFKAIQEKLIATGKTKFTTEKDINDLYNASREDMLNIKKSLKGNYLDDIADCIEKYQEKTERRCDLADQYSSIKIALKVAQDNGVDVANLDLENLKNNLWEKLPQEDRDFLENWKTIKKDYESDVLVFKVGNRELKVNTNQESLSGTKIPKVALPNLESYKELLKYKYKENLPGSFPFTSGVFPFKRVDEDPKRQFAGEGQPERTNKRFHYLCEGEATKRLSVAFDGITLYGEDPSENPDIFGKIGESGVSIATIDDMRKLFEGFDLLDKGTSVSMTINGPAPIILSMYFMVAVEKELSKQGLNIDEMEEAEYLEKRKEIIRILRGTVQADVLKEDQGQNSCIFSIDFSMRLLGDVQAYFSANQIRSFYSISISGYHIAEAGANPITQLAFTLANAFCYVEYFLSRGIPIDAFAPNLSFFFSNGMEPEYSVLGRVARRIWAITLKKKYGANEKSQKLKYHIQTSGRSLHAQEIDFNDIRTTLQAFLAISDNCNSLHTNSYDEAVTTPTEESVRRSIAIQLILSKEYGLSKNENPMQGAYFQEKLTDLVEDAVIKEFRNLSRRGGVLGAMETQYQRRKIQEESMLYEYKKDNGDFPIIGVNTYLNDSAGTEYDKMEVRRASKEEKNSQISKLYNFKKQNANQAEKALDKLEKVILSGGNSFEEMLNTVRFASLGQITNLLYKLGGKYRRGV